jgi:hypothetical protein
MGGSSSSDAMFEQCFCSFGRPSYLLRVQICTLILSYASQFLLTEFAPVDLMLFSILLTLKGSSFSWRLTNKITTEFQKLIMNIYLYLVIFR